MRSRFFRKIEVFVSSQIRSKIKKRRENDIRKSPWSGKAFTVKGSTDRSTLERPFVVVSYELTGLGVDNFSKSLIFWWFWRIYECIL